MNADDAKKKHQKFIMTLMVMHLCVPTVQKNIGHRLITEIIRYGNNMGGYFMKKLVTMMLLLCLLLSTICDISVSADSVSGSDIVKYAKEWLGTPYSQADCSYFVCKVYEKCGIDLWKYRTSLTKATVDAGIATKVGSSMEELFSIGQVGDLVHFPGHIAIYIGNKQVIHSTSSKGVTITTLSASGYWGGTGKKVDRIARLNIMSSSGTQQTINLNDNAGSNVDNQQTVSSVNISPNSYPIGNLKYGDDFTLTAKFTSDCAIVEARAYMLDSNKNVIMEAKGSSTTGNYYVEGYALDKGMKFNELSPGGYYLKYYVKDANGDTNTWISDKFYIVKEEEKKTVVDMSTIDTGTQSTPKEPESTLSINLTNCPSSIKNGESVLLMGTISSNYLIKEAEVVIFASNGIGHYPTTIYPNSKSVRIENTDLSDGIYFEGLPGGTYRIVITAKDEKTTKETTKSIKISKRKIEEDDNLYSADIDIEINNNKNVENTKKQKCGKKCILGFR